MGNCLVWGGDTKSMGLGYKDFEVFMVLFDWGMFRAKTL